MHQKFALALISLIVFNLVSIGYIYYRQIAQESQFAAFRDEINASVTQNQDDVAQISDRLTFLAEKVNPLIGAECHIDQIFPLPDDIPEGYAGYVFPIRDYQTGAVVGLGAICR